MKVGRKPAGPADRDEGRKRSKKAGTTATRRRPAEPAARGGRPRALKQGPQTAPMPRPVERPARPKTTSQAKARAKARKAKAPKVVRPPLRERLIARLAAVDLRPQTLMARVPFVVLVIGSLAVGLAVTLWLSTDAAQRSYQLGNARATNEALTQQKEALERDVLEAESAPALAEAARNLGMIPSKDTAHLVQDPSGNWIVVGKPKPAEGAPPPPLNTKLPDEKPPAPAPPAAPKPIPGGVEVPTRITPLAGQPPAGSEVPVHLPSATDHAPSAATLPGPPAAPGLTIVPVDPQLAAPPAAVPPVGALPPALPLPAVDQPAPPAVPAVPLTGGAQ